MNSWSLKACAIIAPFLSFFELIQIRTEHMPSHAAALWRSTQPRNFFRSTPLFLCGHFRSFELEIFSLSDKCSDVTVEIGGEACFRCVFQTETLKQRQKSPSVGVELLPACKDRTPRSRLTDWAPCQLFPASRGAMWTHALKLIDQFYIMRLWRK